MNSVKAIVGTALLTTAGIIAGGVATGGFTHSQAQLPTTNNEFALINEKEADQFIRQHFPKELKKLKR